MKLVDTSLNIDEKILERAEEKLNSIGMNLNTAIEIFLERIVAESTFPLTMKSSYPPLGLDDRFTQGPTENSAIPDTIENRAAHGRPPNKRIPITRDMTQSVWVFFREYYRNGGGDKKKVAAAIALESGMSEGSAYIYLVILDNLIEGKINKRNMKLADLSYCINKIEEELGQEKLSLALSSLERSLPYWRERINIAYADQVEQLVADIKERK
jgi:antitoxin component of RelBE/YafQ-DinJ toxin-antitoxin module